MEVHDVLCQTSDDNHLFKLRCRKCCYLCVILSIVYSLRENCTLNQNSACFVGYLNINPTLKKKKISALWSKVSKKLKNGKKFS